MRRRQLFDYTHLPLKRNQLPTRDVVPIARWIAYSLHLHKKPPLPNYR